MTFITRDELHKDRGWPDILITQRLGVADLLAFSQSGQSNSDELPKSIVQLFDLARVVEEEAIPEVAGTLSFAAYQRQRWDVLMTAYAKVAADRAKRR